MVFNFEPSPPPLWKFLFSLLLSFKNLAFENPHLLEMSSDHPCGGYGYFLEPHNNFVSFLKR